MRSLLILLLLAMAGIAAPVVAQTLPPAVIVIVNLERVVQTSAAGKIAEAELKIRLNRLQSRSEQLRTAFAAEEKTLLDTRPTSIATGADWEAKLNNFKTRRNQAEQELIKTEKEFQASRRTIYMELNRAVQPIITAIMKERGASIALNESAILQYSGSVDVTNDVITRLNKVLPRISTATSPGGTVK